MKKRLSIIFTLLLIIVVSLYFLVTRVNLNMNKEVGSVVDNFNGVNVYYNGGVAHVEGRNVAADGYNLGLKYQCVEFVKRYYYEYFRHKMPDSYGHAKSFYDPLVTSGAINPKRALIQFKHGTVKPAMHDLIVFDSSLLNRYGHVAIISKVGDDYIEIIQQNPGPFSSSRETISLLERNGGWLLDRSNVLGFLRLP